jgi:uncharacterized protein GlcG (DUF336 family)
MIKKYFAAAFAIALCSPAYAQTPSSGSGCSIPASIITKIQSELAKVVKMDNGGIFSPNLMWSAVVERSCRLCSVIKTGDA